MLRVISLSCNYPSLEEPVRGVFIESRLRSLSKYAEVRVICPAPLFDYGRWRTGNFRMQRKTGGVYHGMQVYRPRWVYPPVGSVWNAISLAAQLIGPMRRLRREYPFDLIDAHFAFPEGIAAALISKALGCPFVVTLRGNEPLHCKGALTRRMTQWMLRRAARVIAVSDDLRDFAVRLGADASTTRVIPNGVDASLFYPRDRAQSRHLQALPPGAKTVLSAGYLIERKGHHRIMQALHDVSAQTGPVHLLIAGGLGREGDYSDKLRSLRDRLGMQSTVHFLGTVAPDELAELMSAVDAFCLATTREGWPNVVNEALACGAPVVATDVGGVRTMLSNPECGIMVPVDDPVALRDALASALVRTWDRAKIAAHGRSRSWEQVAADVMDTIADVPARSAALATAKLGIS